MLRAKAPIHNPKTLYRASGIEVLQLHHDFEQKVLTFALP
jgi:hypothetical protein